MIVGQTKICNKIDSLTLEQDTINTELDTLDKNIIETKRNLDATNISFNSYKEATNTQLDSLNQSLTHTQDIFSSELNNIHTHILLHYVLLYHELLFCL